MAAVFVGLATLDVVQWVPRLPRPDKKLSAEASELAAGGPAANAAKAFASLGGRARLLTVLGDTTVGRLVRAQLEGFGVEVVDLGRPDAEPPIAVVSVTSATGERAIVDAPGRPDLGPLDAVAHHVADASCVLLDGHHASLAVAAACAARGGAEVVLDAGRPKPIWDALVPAAGTAICSADFRLAGVEPAATASGLLARGVRRVAITGGPAPIRWWDADARPRSGRVQVPAVDAVDTLGAGDVLHGAYCWYITQGCSFEEALAHAAALASDRCARRGLDGWLRGHGAARA